MSTRMWRLGLAVVLASLTLSAGIGEGQLVTKDGYFAFAGTASGPGNFLFKVVARGADCTAGPLFELTQAYDAVPGGALPTTAAEIRNAVRSGLSNAAASGFAVYNWTSPAPGSAPGVQIHGNQMFDVCVDGDKILGSGITDSYIENGITVTGYSKEKRAGNVPAASTVGLLVLGLLMAGGTWVILRRQSLAGLR